MKKTILFFLPCFVLSLLMMGGCSSANSHISAQFGRATMEELAKEMDCLVRAKCTKKVLNTRTNEIDATFDIEEVFFGDVPLGKQTFSFYPDDVVYRSSEEGGFPDDFDHFVSPDDVEFERGESYLLLLRHQEGTGEVEYGGSVPYESVSSGTLQGKPVANYVTGLDMTTETPVEEFIEYLLFAKSQDYMNPAKSEYRADSEEKPWNPVPSFDRELQQATHIVKATCQSYTYWDLGFVYEFSVDEAYVGETEETIVLRDSLSQYWFDRERTDGVLYQPGQTYYLLLQKEYSVFEENNFVYKAVNRSLWIPADDPENALYYGKAPMEYADKETADAIKEQGLFAFLETYRNENALPYVGDVPILETDTERVVKESPLVLKIQTGGYGETEAAALVWRIDGCTVTSVLKGDMTEGAMLDMAFCAWGREDERNVHPSNLAVGIYREYIVAVKKDGDTYVPTSRNSVFPVSMEDEIREMIENNKTEVPTE